MANQKPARNSVLLINPCYEKSAVLGPFAEYISSQLPLSLGFLAGYLRSRNVPVTVLDEQLSRVKEADLADFIERQGIRIIGITVLTLTSGRAYELGALIRKNWPHAIVVMGGIHVTLLPEEPLEQGAADIVVRHEGEVTFHEVVRAVSAEGSWKGLAGISFLNDGVIVHNPSRPLIGDLDTLPPFPYDIFEKDLAQYQFGNILVSRGCPYECIFCSQRAISGRRYRVRSAQNIFRELETMVFNYHQKFIFFNDDNFLVNRALVRELCDLIIQREFPEDVLIGFNGRGDSLESSLLRHMRRARFAFILIGFETGSERLMRMIKKGETVRQIDDGVRAAKAEGYIVGGQYILGFPTESRKDTWLTVLHALKLPIDFVRFNLLVPYPGTEVYEMLKQEIGDRKTDWSRYATHGGLTGKGAPYVPKGRSQREMVMFQWIAHVLFFARPRQLFNLRNLRFATAGQLRIPEPTSWSGFKKFMKFVWLLVRHLVCRQK